MANFKRDASPRLSLREKALVKHRVNKEHNSNFRAGYVHINEEHLHKTGVRGRKAHAVYIVSGALVLLALLNITLTWYMMGTLGIDRHGMGALEFYPSGQLLHFLEKSEIDHVSVVLSTVGSLPDGSLHISGEFEKELQLKILQSNNTKASLALSPDDITVNSREGFTVADPDTGQVIFSADLDKHLRFPEEVQHLHLEELTVDRVTSDINERLNIASRYSATLRGSKEVQVDSASVEIAAKRDLDLNTKSALVLVGAGGYHLVQVPWMPVTTSPLQPPVVSYKVCVCGQIGRVFGVQANHTCLQAIKTDHPCAE